MDYLTKLTIAQLLQFKDPTIRRNAISIWKQLPQAMADVGRLYSMDAQNRANDLDRSSYLLDQQKANK